MTETEKETGHDSYTFSLKKKNNSLLGKMQDNIALHMHAGMTCWLSNYKHDVYTILLVCK